MLLLSGAQGGCVLLRQVPEVGGGTQHVALLAVDLREPRQRALLPAKHQTLPTECKLNIDSSSQWGYV